MTPSRRRSTLQSGDRPVRRRRFLLAGTAISTALLAGCSSQTGSDPDGTDDGSTPGTDTTTDSPESDADAGVFRLLISDRPAAIDDFDSLEVSFDRARVFRNGQSEGETEADDESDTNGSETEAGETETATGTETESEANETDTESAPETTPEASDETAEDDESDGERGFFILDLDSASVDLTRVVGDKAMGVFEDGLPTGQYSKIELYAADVEGIVDGESAAVKIPSGKLQIVKPFEVTADETVEFVFDINVVKKGQSHDYNLLPVISESGVAGRDVSVEEVDRGEQSDQKEATGSGTETDTEGDQTDSSETGADTDRSDGPQPGDETGTDRA